MLFLLSAVMCLVSSVNCKELIMYKVMPNVPTVQLDYLGVKKNKKEISYHLAS